MKKNLYFDELKQNKYLGLYDNIDEIYDLLTMLLNKNQSKKLLKKLIKFLLIFLLNM